MNIGEVIKSKRLEQDLSMNELAKRSELAQSGLSEIESGKRQPTFDNLERIITKGLNMSLQDFFSQESPILSPELHQLFTAAKKLTPSQIRQLAYFLNEFV